MVYSTSEEQTDLTTAQPSANTTSGSGGTEITKASGYITSEEQTDLTTGDNPQVTGTGGKAINPGVGYFTSEIKNKIPVGKSPSGRIIGPDGSPLSGKANLLADGEKIAERDTRGKFRLPGAVPAGARSGEDVAEEGRFDFEFEPVTAGVNYVQEDYVNNPIGEIQYGGLNGTVTDYDGNPVENAGVTAPGFAASTDANGQYEAVAPGGTDTTFTAAGDTVNVSLNAGTTLTQDFQFSRLRLKIVDPELNPLRQTAVTINGKAYETDDTGQVVIDRAEVGDYDLTIAGSVEDEATVPGQGELVERTFGDVFAGVRATVADQAVGAPVESVPVSFEAEAIGSETDGGGEASAVFDGDGTQTVLVGEGDRRYQTERIEVEVVRGEVVEENAELIPRNNTPNL